MISQRTIISVSTGPIFAMFSLNESILGADDRSVPRFLISQGTVPWQPNFVKKWQTPLIRRSGIPKRNGISLHQCVQ